MEPFEYLRAGESREALQAVADTPGGAGRLLAGGTDLLGLLKDRAISAGRLVDIKRVRDLTDRIQLTERGATIGALATLADLCRHPGLSRDFPLLGQAARSAATPQLRAGATIAGNLLQRPRCWYFRNPAFHCWLKGGDGCPARHGQNQHHAILHGDEGNRCCAVHPSDLAPALMALDAEVLLRDAGGGERLVPLESLYRLPTPQRRNETLVNGDLVVAVTLPAQEPDTGSSYVKAMARKTWSFALASAAVRLGVSRGVVRDARVVLGGVAGIPWRAHQAEAALLDGEPSQALFARAADAALADAKPLGHNAYKIPLARGVLTQALGEACPEA